MTKFGWSLWKKQSARHFQINNLKASLFFGNGNIWQLQSRNLSANSKCICLFSLPNVYGKTLLISKLVAQSPIKAAPISFQRIVKEHFFSQPKIRQDSFLCDSRSSTWTWQATAVCGGPGDHSNQLIFGPIQMQKDFLARDLLIMSNSSVFIVNWPNFISFPF